MKSYLGIESDEYCSSHWHHYDEGKKCLHWPLELVNMLAKHPQEAKEVAAEDTGKIFREVGAALLRVCFIPEAQSDLGLAMVLTVD
jgi:hypothetical protein